MSTSVVLPISANYSATETTAQQTLLNNALARFKHAISTGDIVTTRTLLHTINVLSPPSAASASSLGTFLTSIGAALANNSTPEAQSALATYLTGHGTLTAAYPQANGTFVSTSV